MRTKSFAGVALALFLLAAASLFGMATAIGPGSGPASGYVYTNDNAATANSILEYQVGPAGSLTLAGTFATQGAGTGSALASQGAVALTQDGHWLVTVDAASNQVTSFKVGPDGSLSFASIASSQGASPISVTVQRNLVYVLNSGSSSVDGNIAGFMLGPNGQLTLVPGSSHPLAGGAGSSPEQIGFNNDGNVIVVTEKAANLIDTFVVDHNGVAGPALATPSNSGGPYGFAFTNQGVLVLSEAGANTLSTYSVADGGLIRTISGSLPDFGNAPCWVAVSQNGRLAYTSNAHGGTISGYSVSATGTLDLFSSVAAKASVPTLDLALNHNSQFLFALNNGHITSFQTFPDGGLDQASVIAGVPASASGLAAS